VEAVATVRVRYADTDQMGVVYHSNYLRYFEIGRAEWIRGRGLSYRQMEAEGFLLPVVEVFARYRAPARYDDLIEIRAAPADVRRASLRFAYQLVRAPGQAEPALLVEGYTLHACVGADGRPRRLPPHIASLLEGGQDGS
jgi:acyl-CoA thioester hydrolase